MQIKENNVLIDTCTRFMLTTRLRSFMLLERQTYPRDVVIHHQVGRGPFAPSIMPFAVKLETYLRMVKVPYMVIIVLRSISMDEIRCVGFLESIYANRNRNVKTAYFDINFLKI